MTDHWIHHENAAPGFRQFVREWRPTQTPFLPVLALHGSLTQSGSWIVLAEVANTVRMVCPDQRGYGLSDDPGTDTCAEFAADAIAQAKALLPERFVIMGHSFACSIALDVVRTIPGSIAGAILVDPVVPLGKPAGPAAPAVGPSPPPESFASLEEGERHYHDTEEGAWEEPALQRFARDVLMQDTDTGRWRFPYSASRMRRLRTFIASPASDHGLLAKTAAACCPVLIFRGGMSKRFTEAGERPFAQSFPTLPQTILCPTSGHFPMNTEPQIVADGIKRFLATLS